MTGMRMTCDTSGALAFLDSLGEKVKDEIIHHAAQAGAQVMVDEVRQRVSTLGPNTGNLASAIYQVFSRSESGDAHAVFHVSWNAVKAPHGHLLEYGHWKYFQTYVGSDGKWYTRIRPEALGMTTVPVDGGSSFFVRKVKGQRRSAKPGRRASMDKKSDYYVPLPGGPVYVSAKPFIRPAYEAKKGAADAAMRRSIAEQVAAFTGSES